MSLTDPRYYRPEIDGLRAIAVIAVILYHAGLTFGEDPLLRGGYLGVDVFFVISGYLITGIILRELQTGTFSYHQFYLRRARRILPALFTVLIATLPFAILWLLPWQIEDYRDSLLATLTFISNHYFLSQTGYFAADAEGLPLLHTWSLAIEEQFYLFFPLLMVLGHRYLRRHLFWLLLVIALVSLQQAQHLSGRDPAIAFFLLPTRFWELLAGSLLAQYEVQKRSEPPTRWWPSVAGLCLILGAILIMDTDSRHPGYLTLLPVIGTVMILRYGRAGPVNILLASRVTVWTGLISYSLYLWHYPLYAFLHLTWPQTGNLPRLGLIGVSFLLATASYHLIEEPARRRSLATPVFLRRLGMGITSVLIFTLAVTLTGGGMGRYTQEDLRLLASSPLESEQYVTSRYADVIRRNFISDDRPRMLVIGDSYGQDLVNVLYEGDFNQRYQISLFHISGRCGNLMVTQDLNEYQAERDRDRCDTAAGYEDTWLRDAIRKADIIWLASSWTDWQAELLPESIANLNQMTQARILTLGRKDFGEIRPRRLLNVPVRERSALRSASGSPHLRTNRIMRNLLPPENFIDLQELLCDGEDSCPIFDKDLNLISYDGNHLTRAGARWAGERLARAPQLLAMLSEKEPEQHATE